LSWTNDARITEFMNFHSVLVAEIRAQRPEYLVTSLRCCVGTRLAVLSVLQGRG
jgi:hypothetical protein